MDVRFINPFIAAIQHVFATMLKADILISKPCLKQPGEHTAEVAAIIGISGDAVGSVALCFPMRTAVTTASRFVGTEISQDHPDFADALGELANMVAGSAKAKFEGLNASISLPQVVTGQDLRVLQNERTPSLLLPCDSTLGRFSAEVAMAVDTPRASDVDNRAIATA